MLEIEKQKLGTCIIPGNTAPIPGSMAWWLNRREKVALVPPSAKTVPNNAEEHLLSDKTGQDPRVPVLNLRGKALMPTRAQKARKLIKEGKAKVVGYRPFCIQLMYATGETIQKIVLGIDAGFKYIGYSACSAKAELIRGELELRSDIKRLLGKRRQYRRLRRGGLWHRPPRFGNRGKEDWLAPSIKHKLESHIKLIERIRAVLPIAEIVIEVATFDIRKMQKPEISGIEYQQGELQGYNVREYLLDKWQRKCSYCGRKDIPLEIEHIVPKSRGGSNRVTNLCLACHECNQKKGNKTAAGFGYPKLQQKANKSLRAAAFMNTVRWEVVKHFKCLHTYGYITKYWRILLGLPKTHANDAFVIAGGKVRTKRAATETVGKQIRRQNRSLYKANPLRGGRWKRNTINESKGYRRFDKVMYENKIAFISGLRSSGSFALKTIEGEKVSDSASWKRMQLIERARGSIEEVKWAVPLRTKVQSPPAPA